MSRPGPSAPRNLTLTEELEKLEQSITLTLQEIDHNFSKAHRIVTTSILPLVEQYGEHSRSVWEATKFWKQFFEASANVSLSGYEELATGEDSTAITAEEETTVHDETTAQHTPRPRSADNHDDTGISADQSSDIYHGHAHGQQQHEESVLTDNDGDLSGSTPRPPATKTLPLRAPKVADLSSPYETLRQKYNNKDGSASTTGQQPKQKGQQEEEEDTELLFQQHTARLPDLTMTLGARAETAHRRHQFGSDGDDDDDDNTTPFGGKTRHTVTTHKDPVLHRMPDKTYRIAATPHKGGGALSPLLTKGNNNHLSPIKWKVEPKPALGTDAATPNNKGKERRQRPIWEDSPTSSPEMAVPQLRSAAFMSPYKAARSKGTAAALAAAAAAPRTPGVSVQTPGGARARKTTAGDGASGAAGKQARRYADEITWESDSDEDDDGVGGALGGMSPPKTIQFALPPSKLLQTPGM
ncbi:hypothetical protein VTK26DRAFT_5770 [Humicola hyalothermophila]